MLEKVQNPNLFEFIITFAILSTSDTQSTPLYLTVPTPSTTARFKYASKRINPSFGRLSRSRNYANNEEPPKPHLWPAREAISVTICSGHCARRVRVPVHEVVVTFSNMSKFHHRAHRIHYC